jgi:exosortase A
MSEVVAQPGGEAPLPRVLLGPLPWAVVALLIVALSWPTLETLHARWFDYGYQHGYLVLALCAVLVVREIRRFPLYADAGSPWGLACLALAAAGVIAGQAASVELLSALLLPVLALGAVWALSGRGQAGRLLGPFGYFYFAVPVWDALNSTLQSLTVIAVSAGLRTVKVPAFINGNFIHLPAGTFEVAGGCSGLHYVVVGAALAALLGLLDHERWRTRALLVVVALVLAVVANWLRVFVIVAAGHLTDMQHYLVTEDHYYFGWALFVVVLSPLFYLDHWFVRQTSRKEGVPAERGEIRAGVRAYGAVLLVVLVLGGAVVMSLSLQRSAIHAGDISVEVVPATGWRRAADWSDDRRPVYAGAAAEDAAWLTDGVSTVGIYVAIYTVQHQDGEAAGTLNRPAGVGATVENAVITPPFTAAGPFREVEVLERDGVRRLVWIQLRILGRATSSQVEAKLLQILGLLLGRRDAQVFVLSATCEAACGGARLELREYATQSGMKFPACSRGATQEWLGLDTCPARVGSSAD